MRKLSVLVLLILAACTLPGPKPDPTWAPTPYPAIVERMEFVNPYPGPGEEPQYCVGMVEIPIAVWVSTDGQYLYSQLCGVATAGSWLNIRSDTGQQQSINGTRIPSNWPCERYVHSPAINGNLSVEAIMLDAGGVTLCNLVEPIQRDWHVLPVTSLNVLPPTEKEGR